MARWECWNCEKWDECSHVMNGDVAVAGTWGGSKKQGVVTYQTDANGKRVVCPPPCSGSSQSNWRPPLR